MGPLSRPFDLFLGLFELFLGLLGTMVPSY